MENETGGTNEKTTKRGKRSEKQYTWKHKGMKQLKDNSKKIGQSNQKR